MAEHIGYEAHPYDALMYRFEPGETMATLDVAVRGAARRAPAASEGHAKTEPPRIDFLERAFPADRQLAFGLKMAGTPRL